MWLFALLGAVVLATALALGALGTTPAQAGGQSLSQLNSQLGANAATQDNLSAELASLNSQVASLEHQVALVRGRESAVEAQLSRDRIRLALTHTRLRAEVARLNRLRTALGRARRILSVQLVSAYEQPHQTLMSLVITAKGFAQMLNGMQFLRDAEHSQQLIIAFVTRARLAAAQAADRLRALQSDEQLQTAAASTQVHALTGMNSLLLSRQIALGHIQSARATALANARSQGNRLQTAIATIRAQQAAAAAAAAAAARAAAQAAAQAAATAAAHAAAQAAEQRAAAQRAATPPAGPSPASPAPVPAPVSATPSGGWAIPAAVVMCESGGQNLPPNSAGASGYYQILPSTWTGEGGSGPAAYLAPKSEQDAVAAKLWNGGAGASNWVCAGIVGIS